MSKYGIGLVGVSRSIFDSLKLHQRARTLLERAPALAAPPEVRRAVERAVQAMRCAAACESGPLQLELALRASHELIAAFAHAPGSASSSTETSLETLDRIARLPKASAHAVALAILGERELKGGDTRLEYAALEGLFVWLEAQLETRSTRERSLARWLRLGGPPLVVLGIIGWAIAPTNLALGKQVTASSICSLTPEPPLGRERLFRVVDGREKEQRFAICTELEDKPWVMVDLARARRVNRVVVYPRNDCCYGQQELPLSVEVSLDDDHFETLAKLSSPAIPDAPWRFETGGRQARFVRITSVAKEKRHIVIGEIEVYGG